MARIPTITVDSTAPSPAIQGDIWVNQGTNSINVHNGTGFIPVTTPYNSIASGINSSLGATVNGSTIQNLMLLPTVNGTLNMTLGDLPTGMVALAYDRANARLCIIGSGGVPKSVALT